jgi:proton glutamate symport protein
MRRSVAWLVLFALVAGLVAGAWIGAAGQSGALRVASVIQAVGTLWLNALRMTVGPLVFALLVSAIAGVSDAVATGRLASRAVLVFSVLLVGAAIYAVAASSALLALWPVDRAMAEAFVSGAAPAGGAPGPAGGLEQWLQSLVPSNVVAAAADDAILPLVMFAILFGFALTRLPVAQRDTLTGFFGALAEAMVVIVHWVLLVAPVGVFALALGVGLRAGLGAAGVLLQYVAVVASVLAGSVLLAYLPALGPGRYPPGRFALAVAPAQVVAASTQSSLATLPAMIECARDALGVPARIAHLVLPLAVAVFRFTSPVGNLAVCLFIATLYGYEPGLPQVAAAIAVAFAVSVGAVGLPGQVSFIASIAPICAALGLPIDLLGILIAVEIVPDIFRTVGNVTADLSVTAMLGKARPGELAVNSQ